LTGIVTKASVALSRPDEGSIETHTDGGEARLLECLEAHAAELSLREMDVFEDRALIRCAACRCHYALTVEAFETHQK
jgi:hypothetical protein